MQSSAAHCQRDASYTVRLPVDKGQMGKYFSENTWLKEMESWVIFSPLFEKFLLSFINCFQNEK